MMAAVCLAALLPGLGHPVVSRVQELRVALGAQNMAQGGSWLVPSFRGEARLRKPPLEYWIVAASLKLAGDPRSAFAARLPNALLAVLLTVVIYAGGARLVGRRRALLAAAAGTASSIFQAHGRLAETDVPLALLTMLSVLGLYAALHGPRELRGWLAAGLFAGLGFMVKGPAALAIPLLTLAAFAALTPSARPRLACRRPLAALLVFAAVALPWYLLLVALPGTREATLGAAALEMGALVEKGIHTNPWYYYLYQLPLALLPWGLLLPFAVVDAARRARCEQNLRFLACWFGVSFLALSLLPTKQDHYMLLLLPPSALLLGEYLGHAGGGRPSFHARLVRGYATVLLALLVPAVIALAAAPLVEPRVPPAAWGFAIVLALVTAAGWLARRRNTQTGVVLAIWAAATLAMPAQIFLGRGFERSASLVKELAHRAEPYAARAPNVFFFGHRKDIVDFYLGRRTERLTDLPSALRELEAGSVVLVAQTDKEEMPDLSTCPAEVRFDETRHHLRCLLITVPRPVSEPTRR